MIGRHRKGRPIPFRVTLAVTPQLAGLWIRHSFSGWPCHVITPGAIDEPFEHAIIRLGAIR